MKQLEDSVKAHEAREELEFTKLREGQESLGVMLGEMHGKVDTLLEILRRVNGKT